MPYYEKGNVRIHYEEAGSGFPLLLIPGGGLNSTISFFTGSGKSGFPGIFYSVNIQVICLLRQARQEILFIALRHFNERINEFPIYGSLLILADDIRFEAFLIMRFRHKQ